MSQVIRVPRPENERDVAFYRHHGCPNAKEFRSALDDPDVDLVQFSVGLVGHGMPGDVPFRVDASNPCMVCGAWLAAWFEWQKRLIL